MADTLAARNLDQLRRSFSGEIITPADAPYDEARRLWNALHDRRPAVVVRPGSPSEVATAIQFGREHDLELAIRSGGHSPAGHSGCDGGIVIDLSAMRGVIVDPAARTARANGGALLGEPTSPPRARPRLPDRRRRSHRRGRADAWRRNRTAAATVRAHDRQPPVGRAGHGGWPARTRERERGTRLFWGVRGAGWNFGIVTAFEFGLEPFGPDSTGACARFPGPTSRRPGRSSAITPRGARRRVDDPRHRSGGVGRR